MELQGLVRLDLRPGVAMVTLDSPANRNALSAGLVTDLLAALETVAGDPQLRAVVLAASGPAFCAGADLTEMRRPGGQAKGTQALLSLLRALLALPQPVLARVHGPARAGGLGVIGACDLAVAGTSATFAFSEARIGIAPAVISLTTLPRMAPRPAARALLTGELLGAEQARELGLVGSVVPDQELDAAVATAVAALLQCSPQGLRETKHLLNRPLLARLDAEGPGLAQLSARLFDSAEGHEGMAAFLERRPPWWAGEAEA